MWSRIMVIREWFGEMNQRWQLVRDFNAAAKRHYIIGSAPTLLEARITRGDSDYRHNFSKWMAGGFRIKALTGRPLGRQELVDIGKVVLDNDELVRKMVSLGWDTLEVYGSVGSNGLKWSLKEFTNMGGYLN